MDELSDFSSPIVEFRSSFRSDRINNLVDNCIGTDPPPASRDVAMETNRMFDMSTQTQNFNEIDSNVDERKLSLWLREIYPRIEAELLKGPTPLPENVVSNIYGSHSSDFLIQTYQKISLETLENSQGLAIWLAVHTTNAPVLVLTTVAPHDDWCEHVNQTMKLFVPKRVQSGNFVVFTEMKSIPLKACMRSLCTNPFNRNMFAGSTVGGDICLWRYAINGSGGGNIDVEELFSGSSPHGAAVAVDWAAENRLLTCHSNGYVILWSCGKEIYLEKSFLIQPSSNPAHELTALVSINMLDFVIGTNDGGVYHCSASNLAAVKTNVDITPLKRHRFMVSSLLKRSVAGRGVVVSADLSGQVYYHDIRNSDEDTANVIVQIPLPFKNAITCSRDGSIIFCPGSDGSLECYRIHSGEHSIIKGALQGKGNLIQSSDNGLWIITGLYGDEFQIFYIERS